MLKLQADAGPRPLPMRRRRTMQVPRADHPYAGPAAITLPARPNRRFVEIPTHLSLPVSEARRQICLMTGNRRATWTGTRRVTQSTKDISE